MKKRFLFYFVFIISLAFFTCNCDDIFGKDDEPDYPNPDHGNAVIDEVRDDIENGQTLTLASGRIPTTPTPRRGRTHESSWRLGEL